MSPLTIGFVVNQLSLRGTETVIWTYAHYNELILGNKSIIFVLKKEDDPIEEENKKDDTALSKEWFTSRFPNLYYSPREEIEDLMIKLKVDVCFIELPGYPSDWVPTHIPSILHCVFLPIIRGTVSTAISEFVSRGIIPVLPNIMPMDNTMDDMREELNIPKDAIVFGRYGGYYQFSIAFAHDAIRYISSRNQNIYFIFMHTCPFMKPSKNVIFLPGTRDLYKKRKFINTCDAMLHARIEGETFGVAVGEFAQCEKNIITYRSHQNEHMHILGNQCIIYDNCPQLIDILENYPKYKKDMRNNGYYKYTPEKIIPLFNEFIHKALHKHNK